jgi:DNA-binding beta-propeller fold protein YncE
VSPGKDGGGAGKAISGRQGRARCAAEVIAVEMDAMRNDVLKSISGGTRSLTVTAIILAVLLAPAAFSADKKKKDDKAATPPEPNILERLDYSKIVWPNPPAITRIKFTSQYTGQKLDSQAAPNQAKKSKWMDRLAGVSEEQKPQNKVRYVLGQPFGVAVDSKGLVYVADEKVGAVFIFNTETKDVVDMIKNGQHAKFDLITGLAMDDADRLFVSDANLHHVLVFNPKHVLEATISDSIEQPVGLAVDNENRFLYVADSGRDQVLVFDADAPYKLLRKIGTSGKKHSLTEPGQFSRPVGVAVDDDGNLYVTDTFNNRVEIFDAEGNFISTFGKAGDGPGYLARPKGIAVDCDHHIWVVDSMQNRVHVFNREGRLLIWLGGVGLLPGQMTMPTGIAIDKNNRVFTTEQYPGRLQQFQYITQAEALAEKKRRDEEDANKKAGAKPAQAVPDATKADAAAKPKVQAP